MGRRLSQEINAGSMADIAFLLLVFFLVTTTMDSDWGLQRRLPPIVEEDIDDIKTKERDVFVVLANANDQLLVEGQLMDIADLTESAKKFITNQARSEELPRWEDISVALCKAELAVAQTPEEKSKWEERLVAAELLGNYTITKQVISLQNDRGTSYGLYIEVQNELARAYNELREELAQGKLGESFNSIEEKANAQLPGYKEKLEAIKTVFPQRISEAEPKDVNS